MFDTQTDTEVIAHLVHAHWHGEAGGDLLAAVQRAIAEFKGAYAIAVISHARAAGASSARGRAARWSSASARTTTFSPPTRPRLLSVTHRVAYLEEGDVAEVRREAYAIFDASTASASSAR